ncbi:helix-turn-helix transcriptional regulator [Streptomyces sp. NPDC007117]|uniref:helix-turn-helix transcriptional regulator n=1 Tax=Streptomyces sp. NPDC007117 TaxID=3154314 RepID=UPI0033D5E955
MDEQDSLTPNWVTLGEQIAKTRRDRGWDQAELARRSSNSPNTISNYERGRVPRNNRIPAGLHRVARALGWPPMAAQDILSGMDPGLAVAQGDLFEVEAEQSRESANDRSATSRASGTPDFMDAELMESNAIGHDSFVRQMKRYRKMKEVSLSSLAGRVAELGGALTEADLGRLENGTRLITAQEGKLLAEALGTTVGWIVGSAFSSEAPDALKAPPTAEELQTEAKAMEQRISSIGSKVNSARMQLEHAKQAEAQAIRQSHYAAAVLSQADGIQREMERQYQYLLGRIDSIRAAQGDEPIMQVHPVYGTTLFTEN